MSRVGAHFDNISKNYDFYKAKNSFYYSKLKSILLGLIPRKSLVLEIGCGTGDLLCTLDPRIGCGVDISKGMINIARKKHKSKNLNFSIEYPKNIKFDYIFMSDVIEHLEKSDYVFKRVNKLLNKNGLFVNTMANPIWEPILMLAENMGLKMPEGPHKRITIYNLNRKLKKAGLKVVSQKNELLIPVNIPVITDLFNRYLEKYLKRYAFIQVTIAKKI